MKFDLRNSENTPESDAHEAPKSVSGQQTGGNRPREEKDVIMTDKQDEPESDGPLCTRREIVSGLTISDEQLVALLADEGVREAIARAGKATARDERKELPSVRRKSNGSADVEAGPIQGAAMVTPAFLKAARVTGIRSEPASRQSNTTLPFAAKKPGEKLTPDNQSAGGKSEHYLEEDEISPVHTATKRSD